MKMRRWEMRWSRSLPFWFQLQTVVHRSTEVNSWYGSHSTAIWKLVLGSKQHTYLIAFPCWTWQGIQGSIDTLITMEIKWRIFRAREVLGGKSVLTKLVIEAWRYLDVIANSNGSGDKHWLGWVAKVRKGSRYFPKPNNEPRWLLSAHSTWLGLCRCLLYQQSV